MSARPPSLAGYEVTGELGKGTAGRVVRARQKTLNRVVALKLLDPRVARDKTTLERFKELTGFDGGELEDRYNQLNADYEACVDRAEDLTGRIDSIEDVAADMMEEMEEEIAQISKPEYRAESQKNLAIIRDRSSKMVSAMRQAEQRMAPVLQAFKDEVLRLKHNLNVQAIQSLSGTVSQIEGDVTKLIDDMNKSIAEADSFLASMNTQ